jgi:hypothetical protein
MGQGGAHTPSLTVNHDQGGQGSWRTVMTEALVEPFDSDVRGTQGGRSCCDFNYHYQLTCGHWETERESAEAFDDLITRTGRFTIHREVKGQYQHLRPGQEERHARIDRILIPDPSLHRYGWTVGPVGVELKRSGVKIGKPVAQLLDYTRAIWEVDYHWVTPLWYFLWPLHQQGGPIESILAQNRCGGIFLDKSKLVFHSTKQLAVADFELNTLEVRPPRNWQHGVKTGSR